MKNRSNSNMEGYELFKELVTNMPMIFYVLDKDWKFTLSDGKGLQSIGLEPGQAVGYSAKEMYQYYPDIIDAIERAFRGENVLETHTLGEFHLENHIVPFYDHSNEIIGVIGATIDVTKRREFELELEKSRTFLEALINSVPGMLYMYDAEGKLTFWNKGHEIMTGFTSEELNKKHIMEWFANDPESQENILKGLEAAKFEGFATAEAFLERKDGTSIPCFFTAKTFKLNEKNYIVGVGVDISTRIEAENKLQELNRTLEEKIEERTRELKDAYLEISSTNEELSAMNQEMQAINNELVDKNEQLIEMQAHLVESEKMAALGGLVAGVAHEVNTPLGVSITAASHLSDIIQEIVALEEIKPLNANELKPFLEDIHQATNIIMKNLQRAGKLIKSFKQLSVDQASEPKREFEVTAYLEEILVSLSPTLKKTNITVTTYCPEPIMMDGYPGGFAQIITNLMMNSLKHAYGHGDNGNIRIEITKKGLMVQLIFSDDGLGMDEQTVAKIYEPFFTTKRSSQEGSGLGLSVVYSIVTQQFKGSITCISKLNEGTTFKIELKQGGL